MRIHREQIEQRTRPDTDVHDLSERVAAIVARSGIEEGMVLVSVAGSTAAVTTIEFEPGAVADLKRAIDRLAPTGAHYEHDAPWGDGNGYAHVRAALLGPSLTLPVAAGRVLTGTWQQIILCDFDNRPRRRRILVQVVGAAADEKTTGRAQNDAL